MYKSNDKSVTPSENSTFDRKSSIKRESTILSSYLNMEKKTTIEPIRESKTEIRNDNSPVFKNETNVSDIKKRL